MPNGKLIFGAVIATVVMSATLMIVQGGPSPGPGTAVVAQAPPARVGSDHDQRTIEALSGLLEREVEERIRLEQEVERLSARLAALEDSEPEEAILSEGGLPPQPVREPDAPVELSEAALVAAGFSPSDAAYYRRRYDEAAMARLYLRDQAEREGWIGTPRYSEALREIRGGLESLRDEMDDEAYARYLYALGRPNQVSIRRVLTGSAAEAAGLAPGDVLLSYQGERMFAVSDVRRASRGGDPGETVSVEILRDGRVIQAYLPRGPLGVSMSSERTLPADDS